MSTILDTRKVTLNKQPGASESPLKFAGINGFARFHSADTTLTRSAGSGGAATGKRPERVAAGIIPKKVFHTEGALRQIAKEFPSYLPGKQIWEVGATSGKEMDAHKEFLVELENRVYSLSAYNVFMRLATMLGSSKVKRGREFMRLVASDGLGFREARSRMLVKVALELRKMEKAGRKTAAQLANRKFLLEADAQCLDVNNFHLGDMTMRSQEKGEIAVKAGFEYQGKASSLLLLVISKEIFGKASELTLSKELVKRILDGEKPDAVVAELRKKFKRQYRIPLAIRKGNVEESAPKKDAGTAAGIVWKRGVIPSEILFNEATIRDIADAFKKTFKKELGELKIATPNKENRNEISNAKFRFTVQEHDFELSAYQLYNRLARLLGTKRPAIGRDLIVLVVGGKTFEQAKSEVLKNIEAVGRGSGAISFPAADAIKPTGAVPAPSQVATSAPEQGTKKAAPAAEEAGAPRDGQSGKLDELLAEVLSKPLAERLRGLGSAGLGNDELLSEARKIASLQKLLKEGRFTEVIDGLGNLR